MSAIPPISSPSKTTIALRYFLWTFAAAWVVIFFYQSIRNHNYVGGNDLTSYLTASNAFFSGENPYVAPARRYIYPQFLLIVCYPLTFLQSSGLAKSFAAGIWSLLSFASFFGVITYSWRFIRSASENKPTLHELLTVSSLAVLFMHPFLQDEFLNGQVNLIMLGALGAFFLLYEQRKTTSSALAIAIAISLKIAPGIALALALLKRELKPILLAGLMTIVLTLTLPYLANQDSLSYYKYFVTEITPMISGAEAEAGFRSFSLISTVTHIFEIHWYPLYKMLAVVGLTLSLLTPIWLICKDRYKDSDAQFRYMTFAAIISAIPLGFPMSESHHLLLLTLPLLALFAVWKSEVHTFADLRAGAISLGTVVSLALLHVGQMLKQTPLRFLGILGIYLTLIWALNGFHAVSQPLTKKETL